MPSDKHHYLRDKPNRSSHTHCIYNHHLIDVNNCGSRHQRTSRRWSARLWSSRASQCSPSSRQPIRSTCRSGPSILSSEGFSRSPNLDNVNRTNSGQPKPDCSAAIASRERRASQWLFWKCSSCQRCLFRQCCSSHWSLFG